MAADAVENPGSPHQKSRSKRRCAVGSLVAFVNHHLKGDMQ
jgi:hypothetical protein